MEIETSRLIVSAKHEYYANLGKKLSDATTGAKTYWSLYNKLINKKTFSNIPPLFDHGFLLQMWRTKRTFLMIISFHNVVQ